MDWTDFLTLGLILAWVQAPCVFTVRRDHIGRLVTISLSKTLFILLFLFISFYIRFMGDMRTWLVISSSIWALMEQCVRHAGNWVVRVISVLCSIEHSLISLWRKNSTAMFLFVSKFNWWACWFSRVWLQIGLDLTLFYRRPVMLVKGYPFQNSCLAKLFSPL